MEAPPPGPPPAPRSSRKGSRARAWLQQVPLLGCLKPSRYCCFFGAIFGIGSNHKIVPLFTTFPHFAPRTALSPFRGHTAFTRWHNEAASFEPLSRMFVYSGRHDANNHDAAQQLQNSHAPRTDPAAKFSHGSREDRKAATTFSNTFLCFLGISHTNQALLVNVVDE